MTTNTQGQSRAIARPESASLEFLPIFCAALLGLTVIFFAGFAQSAVLHDSAHDTRHAIGFACH